MAMPTMLRFMNMEPATRRGSTLGFVPETAPSEPREWRNLILPVARCIARAASGRYQQQQPDLFSYKWPQQLSRTWYLGRNHHAVPSTTESGSQSVSKDFSKKERTQNETQIISISTPCLHTAGRESHSPGMQHKPDQVP